MYKIYDIDAVYGWLKRGTGSMLIKGGFELKIHRNVINFVRVWKSGTDEKREILIQISKKTFGMKFIATIIKEAYNEAYVACGDINE